MSTLTKQDILGEAGTGKKPRMPVHVYNRLTGGDDTVCEAAIEAAEVWVTAKVAQAGATADFTDSTVKEAAIKRTLYELYSQGENEEIARDKSHDALVLLRAKHGSVIDDDSPDNEPGDKKGNPVISTVAGSTNWNGFS